MNRTSTEVGSNDGEYDKAVPASLTQRAEIDSEHGVRRHPRFTVDLQPSAAFLSDGRQARHAELENISLMGASVLCSEPSIGNDNDEIRFVIHESFDAKILTCICRVTRCEDAGTGEDGFLLFKHGLEFLYPSPEFAGELKDYIASHQPA